MGSCIDTILRDDNVILNAENYAELRKQLRWYMRFERLGEMILIYKKSKNLLIDLTEISLLLQVHYKWLTKFLHKLFIFAKKYRLSEESTYKIGSLSRLIYELNNKLGLVYDPMIKISKRIKKYLILPPPYPSEICMSVHSGLSGIAKNVHVRSGEGNTLKQKLKIVSVQFENALAIRRQTISLWNDVYSRKPISDVTLQTILKIEQFCNESNMYLRTPAEIESVVDTVRSVPEKEMAEIRAMIQLWPIYEYVFMSLACTLQEKICQDEIISSTSAECLMKFADVSSIPDNLVGMLRTMVADIEQRQKVLLLPELFYQLAQFAQESYAVRDSRLLLSWQGVTEDDIKNSISYTKSKVLYSITIIVCYITITVELLCL